MTRSQVTLYDTDTEQFSSIKDEIKNSRNGNEPSNAETLRLLMQMWHSGKRPI